MKRRYAWQRFIHRTGIWLGLFAMVLQTLTGTAHAGAIAAAVTGNMQPLSGAFGLLQICTPLGIVEIDPRQSVPSERRSFEQQCPLCAAPALCSFSLARAAQAPYLARTETPLILIPRQSAGHKPAPGRKGLSRAPPV